MILKLTRNTLLSGMLILMVACGGGGGGGTADTGVSYSGNTNQATLTDANAGQLASSSLSNGDDGGALVLSATGSDTLKGPNTSHSLTMVKAIKDLVSHIEDNPETISTVNSLAVTTQTSTLNGDCGGQATFTFSVGTGTFSGSMSFSSYCSGNETITGSVTISGQADGSGQITSLTMIFTRLSFRNGNESSTATGRVSISTASNTVTVEMKMQNHVTNRTCWVNNYSIEIIDYGTYEQVTINSGRFYDFEHGYVNVVTTSPLLTYYGAEYPYSGSIKISAANNATATLTANPDGTTCTLVIDNNGDGRIDTTWTGLWTDL